MKATSSTGVILAVLTAVGAGCSGPDPLAGDTANRSTAPAPAPVSTTSNAKPEGAAPAVLLGWGDLPAGALAADSGSVPATLQNHTRAPIAGTLTIVTSGLDGKLVETPLGPFSADAGGTLALTVPVSALPIQSETSSSFVTLQAEIALKDGSTLRSATPPLYYHFEGGYQRALFYTGDDMLAKHNGGAIGAAGAASMGRLRGDDGTWLDVATTDAGPTTATLIPRAEADAMAATMSTTSALTAQPAALATNFSVTICTTWRVQYIDAGFGEDAINLNIMQDVPARFAYYEIWQGSTMFWHGFLNGGGCVTTSMPSGSLQFRQFTNNTREFQGANPNTINSWVSDSAGNTSALSLNTNYTVTGAGSKTFHPTMNVPAVQVAVVAAQILFQNVNTNHGLGMNNYTLNVRAPFGCSSVDPPTDSCYDSGTDFTNIGTTVVGTTGAPHSQWKSIIAHEIGHNIQHRQWGSLNNDYSDNATSEPLCRCDHYTTAWSNQFHCMNSREFMGAAEVEAYAHASATRTFNNDDSGGNAKFVYYKPFLGFFDDGSEEVEFPPVPFTLSSTFRPRWLATECPAGLNHEGNEYDWLTFYYAISVTSIANPTTFNDLAAIYKRTCTGGTGLCNGQNPFWSDITSAALAYYGGSASNPKYLRFINTGSSAGVNF